MKEKEEMVKTVSVSCYMNFSTRYSKSPYLARATQLLSPGERAPRIAEIYTLVLDLLI
jgi:hypothetical protein